MTRPWQSLLALVVAGVMWVAVAAPPVEAVGARTLARGDTTQGPQPGDDFAVLPARCYDDRGAVTSPCRLTSFPKRPRLVVWGDSHAQMYLPALRRLSEKHRINLTMMLYGSCPVSNPYPSSADKLRTGCDRHNEESLRYLRSLVARGIEVRLVIGGFWSNYRANYEKMQAERAGGPDAGIIPYHEHMAELAVERSGSMLRLIDRLGVPVDLIAQAAHVPADARRCLRGEEPYLCELPRRRGLPDEEGNRRFVERLASLVSAPTSVVDPSPLYCTPVVCRPRVDGVNTFYDRFHLGKRLTGKTGPWFRPIVTELAR